MTDGIRRAVFLAARRWCAHPTQRRVRQLVHHPPHDLQPILSGGNNFGDHWNVAMSTSYAQPKSAARFDAATSFVTAVRRTRRGASLKVTL
jgi:hypothetical protein